MSATPAVDALLDEKAIEHLDFAPTCETAIGPVLTLGFWRWDFHIRLGRLRPCREAAAGVLTCRVCGTAATICYLHLSAVAALSDIECSACESQGPGAALFRFTPWPGA
jgi:hypothetical protein